MLKAIPFRIKILFTLIVVITSISFFAFLIFTHYLNKNLNNLTEQQFQTTLELLKEQYLYSLTLNGDKLVYPFLEKLESNENVTRTVLLNSDFEVVYPPEQPLPSSDSLLQSISNMSENSILVQQIKNQNEHLLRTIMALNNSRDCYECHSASEKNLGYIVVDYSLKNVEANIAFTKKFGIIFSLFLFLATFVSIGLVHYKFVRKSLKDFRQSITTIEQGNLNERVKIPESEELGELAKSFNDMVAKLQKAQEQLKLYHQKELLNAQKMASIGEMAASLAHEIKNPLTGIVNAIEIIVQEMPEGEQKPILEEVQRQAKRVNKAINDLLQFSRPVALYIEPGDINAIIKSVIFFLKNQSHHKKIQFKVNLQPDIPQFYFDHVQIENVISNLGLNAVQAIRDEGIITFKSRYNPKQKRVFIIIEDNGVGIPKERLSKIFKPFFTTRHKGTGLGLAITKEIIERHHGEITVDSRIHGGSIFTISLPMDLDQKIYKHLASESYEKFEGFSYR